MESFTLGRMWKMASPHMVPTPSAIKNCIVSAKRVVPTIGKKKIPTRAKTLMMTTEAVP